MEKSYFWWFCWLGLGNPCHIATKTPLEKLHQNLGLADPHPPQLGQKTKFFDRSHLRAPLSIKSETVQNSSKAYKQLMKKLMLLKCFFLAVLSLFWCAFDYNDWFKLIFICSPSRRLLTRSTHLVRSENGCFRGGCTWKRNSLWHCVSMSAWFCPTTAAKFLRLVGCFKSR